MFSCDRCEVAGTSSIFTLSDNLVLKLADGITPEIQETKGVPKDVNEREWMEKLRCIDNAHSVAYHLNEDGFNGIVHNLEKTMGKDDEPSDLLKREIIKCLKENPNCSLKCERLLSELTEAYDLQRVQRVKRYYDEKKKKKIT